jgi:predicted house-cleaning noncanonical NTP pyrophosphatase (MazG superfamily)
MIPKLVRDKIPELICARGAGPVPRRLDPSDQAEVIRWFQAKLQEEVLEYLRTGDPAEIVDIIDVCCQLWCAETRLSHGELVAAMESKNAAKGAFDDLIVLEEIVSLGGDGDVSGRSPDKSQV